MAEPKIANILSGYQREVKKQIKKTVKSYKEKEKIWQYTEVGLTLFIILLFVIFAIRPTALTIFGLLGEIEEKEEIDLRMRQKINMVLTAQEEYALVQERVSLIDSYLPVTPSIGQGITQVIGISANSTIELGPINISRVELINEKGFKRKKKESKFAVNLEPLALAIGSSGDYLSLRSFITDFLEVRRMILIDRYQISASQDEEEKDLQLSLGANLIYWLVDNTADDQED